MVSDVNASPGELQPGCQPRPARWDRTREEGTMTDTPVIEKFLQAIEGAMIPGGAAIR
jgi:hypothetical protein